MRRLFIRLHTELLKNLDPYDKRKGGLWHTLILVLTIVTRCSLTKSRESDCDGRVVCPVKAINVLTLILSAVSCITSSNHTLTMFESGLIALKAKMLALLIWCLLTLVNTSSFRVSIISGKSCDSKVTSRATAPAFRSARTVSTDCPGLAVNSRLYNPPQTAKYTSKNHAWNNLSISTLT